MTMRQGNRTTWSIIVAMSCTLVSAALEKVAANELQGVAQETELRERFGEQQFGPQGGFVLRQGQKLPNLVWEHPDLVSTVVDDPKIPTRWFNDRFEEVQVAREPGRYYAYGRSAGSRWPPTSSGNDVLLRR